MKKYILYISCFLTFGAICSSCEDFLDRDPLDKLTNDSYWVDEVSLRAYAQDFYLTYFTGYAQDYRLFGGYFSGDSYNDDFLLSTKNLDDQNQRLFFPTTSLTGINSTITPWATQYKMVRKANVMLEEIPGMDIDDEAKAHWTGVARFFRAMAHSTLTKIYGDVPYIDIAVDPADNETLYKNRDPQLTVVNKIMEDYYYAIEHVRSNDGTLQVHKYLVAAMMSRDMLYHATWLKYHGTTVGPASQPVEQSEIAKFLDAVVAGAEVVMNSNEFSIGDTYNALFSSESLAGNPEIIFYREYASGILPNALLSYNADKVQEQGGVTVDAVNSYLCLDGLPIGQSPLYDKTDLRISSTFKDRDPRLYDTLVDSMRLDNSGFTSAGSITGFVSKKFLNEQMLADNSPYITGLNSPIDAPHIRYAEVLLNYVEARYELSTIGGKAFSQEDLDKSINQIRKRTLTKWGESPAVPRKLPTVTLNGNSLSVNGVVINDPDRDQSVDPILWEIRRERRCELIMEGRRGEDLNRWAKFEYLNTNEPTPSPVVLGVWIDKADYPGIDDGIKLYNPANPSDTSKGYVQFYNSYTTPMREFKKGELNSERNYLRSIPAVQITTYKDKGYTLSQNPGWE